MKLELVNEPLKATQTIALCDLQDIMITVNKRTRIIPVIETDTFENIGYYLVGDIYLGADTLVNTSKGAVGHGVEKLSREAFIHCKNIDLKNTKADELSEKEFRKIEIQAYRDFEKMYETKINHNKFVFNNKRYNLKNSFHDLDLYIYLFDPEEHILIKTEETIMYISKFEDDIIICDKKKNSYIKIAKEDGVQIHNSKGEIVNVGGTGAVIINDKNLSDIISSALKPLSHIFDNF